MGFGSKKYSSDEQRTSVDQAVGGLLPDEPYFIIRGKDLLAPVAIEAYAGALEAAAAGLGCGTFGHVKAIYHSIELLRLGSAEVRAYADKVREWQADNDQFVKLPD